MFKMVLNWMSSILPWGWKQFFQGAALLVGTLEDSGLTFTAGGIVGPLLLLVALKLIVWFGGPIPLTPSVIFGMNLWLALQFVLIVHTCVDGILMLLGERPLAKL